MPPSPAAPAPVLVLASASPRRRALLRGAGVELGAIHPAHIPEEPRPGEAAVAFARRICQEKAAAVAAELSPEGPTWVLAADTVVHLGEEIMGKPTDDAHAAELLGRLSGTWHRVTTAWSLRHVGPAGPRPPAPRRRTAHVTSRVRFRALSARDIARYIATGEGRDKAGSYAIQGVGMVLVDRLVGSYTNVVGLPVAEVLADLAPRGLAPAAENPS